MTSLRFMSHHLAYVRQTDQQPGTVPMEEAADLAALVVVPSGNVPVTGQGGVAVGGAAPARAGTPVVEGDTIIVDNGGGGLSPRLLISVEPNGMPALPVLKVGSAGMEAPAPLDPAPAQALEAMPPPSNSAVPVGDVDPTAGEQPMVEGGAGLMPGAANSVAPSGTPMGPTGLAGPRLRGVATLSGAVLDPAICACAEPKPMSATVTAGIAKGIFMA
jgi:hypothetical protein